MKKILTTTLLILAGFISVFASGHIVSIITTTNVNCFGMCDGSATAIASGGIGPYAYAWTGPSGYTSANATATNMCAGTYTVTATDSSDMSIATANVTINQPAQLTVTVNSNGMSCGNCNGTATAVASGGIPPYSYLWNTFNGDMFNPFQNNLCAGTYNLTVTDNYGCNNTGMVTISNSPGFILSITTTPATCDSMNGSACVNIVTGGVPPFNYQWSTGAIGSCQSNLSAGLYYVTIVDSNSCQQDTVIQISNSNGVNIVLDSIVNINCNNNSVGSITVHGTGGTGIYQYNWSNGDTTATITTLTPVYYAVNLSDSNNCSIYASYNILNTYNLYAAIQTTNANCSNNGTASITNVSGVNPPFTFLWNDSLNQTTQNATNLAPGNYNVTITDNIGCTIIANAYIYPFNYNIIKGRVYSDANQNCIQDNGELGIPNIVVMSTPGFNYGYTNSLGDYTIYTNQMNNSIIVSYNYLYTPTCPSTGILYVNFTNSCGDTVLNNDFGYYNNPSYFNLSVLYSWSSANPGFTKTYRLSGHNSSLFPQNAILRLTYDSVLQYLSSTYGGINNSTLHTVEWPENIILPSTYWNNGGLAIANFYVPLTVSITDTLCTLFEILPISGDAYPIDNTKFFCQHVTGSFDPNSKDVYPKGQGAQGYILQSDSVLNYTIHFQNTGNDTAFTVIVIDTLSQYLDPGTLVKGISSYPCTLTLTEQGILNFRFDQILLPDSNINEPASNGYVNYTVNLKPNLPIGTEIKNTASIFFDFNSPVITNTTLNTIASPLQIKEIESKDIVSAFPNPFKDFTTIKIKTNKTQINYSFELIDIIGNDVIIINNIKTKEFNISNSKLVEGIYFYIVKSNEKIIGSGKLIKN